MAKTKAAGKTRQKPPRKGRSGGVKVYGGQKVKPGNIIVRQVGSTFHSGSGAKMGRDFTIFAIKEGIVEFGKRMGKKIIKVI